MFQRIKLFLQALDKTLDKALAPLNARLRATGEKMLGFFGLAPYRKRGRALLSVAVILFAGAIGCYILFGLLSGLETPISTMPAVEYTSAAGAYCSGYIVRSEKTVTSQSTITSLLLSEGQKVAVGQPLAMGYSSAGAQQRQLQIVQLEEQLVQLEYASETSAVYDQAAMDADIRERLMDVAVLLSRGRISDASDMAPELKGLVLRRFSDEAGLAAIREQADATRTELNRLRSETSGSVQYISAPAAGYFSGTVDGYESVLTPEAITVFSVSELENLAAGAQPAGAVGKVILGDVWYYLTALPAQNLSGVKVGDTVSVSFSGDIHQSVPMEVYHISQEENGQCVLALSCNHYMQDMTLVRRQSADVVLRTYEGLRVPKEAVRVEADGTVGVFILESAAARWKSVEILHDNGESYVVKLDKTSTRNLWPGDEIILSAEELYDGKVIF